jgi:site-specific DNA-methyltransferase (adenine-specific)
MDALPDRCIALVVTSPPYFAGKEYETELGEGGIPATYLEYLGMLRDVFAECWRVLEPGGRIAVNVANLGRKPYRSLSADVIRLLQDDLGFLLRGEIVWVKGKGANGNCAWGSYASAANPVLRDVTERIVMASKGRFDRVPSRTKRKALGLPFEDTIDAGDFRTWTLDTWHFAPESAKRIGHPAPFPVELPRRVIELNTYKDDCVLDPFLGSGQTALACIDTGRHYVGIDVDPGYVDLARARISQHSGTKNETQSRTENKLEDKEKRRRRAPSKLAPLPQRARGGTGTDG